MDLYNITPEESLFRGVLKNDPEVWNPAEQRPTSATFKDKR